MANEAFALSPISARAASPTDADFEAIREAFLETARGRWFLDEYTKRNRNADTAMVLEAVARIENSLAAQKEEQQRQALSEPPPVEPPSNALPEAMATVRAIVAAARANAASVLAGPALEEALAPSRKCARVIREIAWGLRESGADGRICTLLDSQVNAINAACDHVAAGGLKDGVLRAFDQAAIEIDGIAPSAMEPQAEAKPFAAIHLVDPDPAPDAARGDPVGDEMFEAAITLETSQLEPMAEVILPDAEAQPAERVGVYTSADIAPEPAMTTDPETALEAIAEPVTEIIPAPVVAAHVSTLGESLIANGIIAKPTSPRSDPLAPIRRMSQAERIAFFS